VAAVRRALKRTDPVIAASGVATLTALVMQANALPRLRALILAVFSTIAVGIVSLGSYGVMSQLVSNRERELAVRLVFGARPAELGGSVLLQIIRLTVPGIIIGLLAVWATSGFLRAFLLGLGSRSILAPGAAAVLLLLLSLVAALPAACRAMKVDVRQGVAG
jgi:ABC-type antimicrobial peptide transport system permease subunit